MTSLWILLEWPKNLPQTLIHIFVPNSIDNLASSISDENLYATPRGDHPDVVLNNGDVSRRASDVEDFVKASAKVAAERSAATLWKGDLACEIFLV